MIRVALVLAIAGIAACAQAPAERQQALQGMIGGMNSRLNAQPSGRQVISDSSRLAAGFSGLVPYVGGFGESDNQVNRELAQAAFAWLARASSMFASDQAVSQSLMQTYGVIGDFYRNHGASVYPSGAALAYAGGNHLARSMVVGGHGGRSMERELERSGLEWAAVSYMMNGGPPAQGVPPEETVARPVVPVADIQPAVLPDVDESRLDDQQKAAWSDVRERFMNVAPKVQQARLLLAQLSSRLESQGPNMTLNTQDAAAALMMQGFLDDSVEFIRARQFEKASEALVRADYQRQKLKSVTGQ